MNSLAYVFPGQGSQAVGMGRELVDLSAAAAAVFAAADDALGEPISRLAWDGPEDELNRTENAQPALLTTSIAYLAALRERQNTDGGRSIGPAAEPRFMAGHSMGQYSALVAAGVVSLEDGVRLVRERGVRMQQSGAGRDGAMAAVIGLDETAIPKLVRLASGYGVFGVANRNSPGQVVVSGERPAIDAALEIAKSLGARLVKVLPVSVAAHSPLMTGAADAMREVLRDVPFANPSVPLIANADAHLLATGEACRAELVDHLTTGVDWVRAVETMAAAGVDTFIEVGPGKVLTNLIKRIAPDATALALDEAGAPGRLAVPA
jgi:[acyl-carrier-protein] S-malonyltransferase